VSEGVGLEHLLRELKTVSSPVQRIKLLGRGWRTLRRLDRSQLQELAKRAGLERAEGYLAILARDKGRLSPSLLLQIVQRFREVDANEVNDLVQGLGDPERRKELLHGGLDMVDDLLDEEAAEEATPAPEPPPEADPEPEETAVPVAPAVAEPPTPAAEAEPPARAPEVIPTAAATAAPIAAARPKRPEPAAATWPAGPAARPTAAPVPRWPSAGPPREPALGPPPPESTGGESDAVVRSLEGAPSTVRRLAVLRREVDRAARLDVETLRRLLELFPDGWARRRALATLLRAGVPAKLVHAVFLIEQLESPTARRWCAGTLLDSRRLTEDERRALIERHGLFPHRRSAAAGL
jgi:hypothetical protein